MTTYLTAKEIFELKRLCSNPFLELGMTLRPKHLKCFEPHVVTTSVALVIHFNNHEDAKNWNLMNEKRIRTSGHMATVALATLVALIGNSVVTGITVGATTAIAKDEIQANVWYPRVEKNWTLTRTYLFNYQQFPSRYFTMQWTDIIRDENGEEKKKRAHNVYNFEVGGANGIPETLVKNIMTRFPQYKYVEFEKLRRP